METELSLALMNLNNAASGGGGGNAAPVGSPTSVTVDAAAARVGPWLPHNLIENSAFPNGLSDPSPRGGAVTAVTDAEFAPIGATTAIEIGLGSTSYIYQKYDSAPGDTLNFGMFVNSAGDAVTMSSVSSASGEFSVLGDGSLEGPVTGVSVGNFHEFTATISSASGNNTNYGVVRYSAQGSVAMRVTGYHLYHPGMLPNGTGFPLYNPTTATSIPALRAAIPVAGLLDNVTDANSDPVTVHSIGGVIVSAWPHYFVVGGAPVWALQDGTLYYDPANLPLGSFDVTATDGTAASGVYTVTLAAA